MKVALNDFKLESFDAEKGSPNLPFYFRPINVNKGSLLVKFVGKNINEIVKQLCQPHLASFSLGGTTQGSFLFVKCGQGK